MQLSEKHYTATITSRKDFSPHLWQIRVRPEGMFQFTAGQYATLGLEKGSRKIERAYSIVSSPHEEEVEFFIELVPEGKLTPQLYTLREGDALSFRRVAKGRFTFDARSGHTHHLLVCTVTGIAPFVSFVRTLYKNWKDGTMPAGHCLHVLNGASTSSEFGYRAEMERYQSEVPWLKYVPTVSRPWAEPEWAGEQGRVEDILRKYTDQWNLPPSQTTAYLCGHPQMVRNSRDILIRRGLEKGSIREEIYFLPANDPAR